MPVPYILIRQSAPGRGTEAYKGSNKPMQLDNQGDVMLIEDAATLIMWQFSLLTRPSEWKQGPQHGLCSYLGIWDFDFELSEAEKMMMLYGTYPKCIQEVVDVLGECLAQTPYQIYASGNKGIHVYVQNPDLMVSNKGLESEKDMKAYIASLYGDKLAEFIDTSPFRLGCGVRGYFRAHPKTNMVPSIRGTFNGFDIYTFWDFIMDMVRKSEWPVVPSQRITRLNQGMTEISIATGYTDSEKDMLTNVRQLIAQAEGTNDFLFCETHKTAGGHLVFKKQAWCPCAQRRHSRKGNGMWFIFESHAEYKCYSAACSGKKYILKKEVQPLTRVPDEYRPLVKHCTEVDTTQRYYQPEELKKQLQDHDMTLLSIPMGNGKTYSLCGALKDYPNASMCSIGTRISQVECLCERYNQDGLEFRCYNQCPDPKQEKRIYICLNSIPKLMDTEDQVPPVYDILILDEIDSIVAALTGRLLSNNKMTQMSVWYTLGYLITLSKKVIMMDGIPSTRLYDYLKDLGFLPRLSVVQHLTLPDQRKYTVLNSISHFKNMAKYLLKQSNGERGKCVIVSNAKAAITVFHKDITAENALLLTGDSSVEEKSTTKSPTDHWKDIDFLLYNNVIGPGPSFDKRNHFHSMMVYIDTKCGTPIQVYQLINRIRHLTTGNVYIYIEKYHVGKPDTYEELLYKTCNGIKNFHGIQTIFNRPLLVDKHTLENIAWDVSEDGLRNIRTLIGQKRVRLTPESSEFSKCHARTQLYENENRDSRTFLKTLTELITRNGGTLRHDNRSEEDEAEDKKMMGIIRAMKDEITADKGTYLISVDDVEDDEKRRKIHKMVRSDIPERQTYFNLIRGLWAKDDLTLHSIDFEKIDKGAAWCNTTTVLDLVSDFKQLLHDIGCTMDATTGMIQGSFCMAEVYEDPMVVANVRALFNNLAKSGQGSNKEELDLRCSTKKKFHGLFTSVVQNLGYRIKSVKRSRNRQHGNDQSQSYLEFDSEVVRIRHCIARRNPFTLDRVETKKEAFDALL